MTLKVHFPVFIICGKEQREKGKVETKNLNRIYLFQDVSEILCFFSGESRVFL